MASGGMDFDLTGVGSELQTRLLAVPIYQRSYAWTLDEIEEFWSDLRTSFGQGAAEYFLGTVVLTTQGSPPRDSIIDGQQRLATTSILLAAIRDEYIFRGDEKRANIVQNSYLATSDLESAQEVPRLRLNSEDSRFFNEMIVAGNIETPALRGSHKLLLASYTFLREMVSQVASDAGPDWIKRLNEWVEFLRLRVKVIRLEVPTDADAFLIFETLNDRGADLTIADLLKNYLFGHAGSDQLDPVRDTWMQVLGALEVTAENQLFTTYLRHYWSSRHGTIRERDLYKSIKERVATQAQVGEFVADLLKAAPLYSALRSADHEYWEYFGTSTKNNVEALNRLELEQNRPLLLAALQHFTKPEMTTLLRAIVSWSVRGLVVGGIGGGTAEKAYCNVAVKIRNGDVKSAAEVLAEISSIVPSDLEFRAAVGVARVPKASLARYYLLALERGRRGEDEPELVPNANEEEVNLEHVLPKNATARDWGVEFDADERKDYVHRLGNLALLQKGKNGRIGNKPFTAKRPILAKSKLLLTKEIGDAPDWTKDAIADRQQELARLAVKVWPRSAR